MMTRSLLIEKSQLEKKEASKKSMENRLRLGQFVTQRQGTSLLNNGLMDMILLTNNAHKNN